MTDLCIEPLKTADGRIAMVGAAHRRQYGGFDVALAPAAPVPPDARLAFTLSDGRGRKLAFAILVPDAPAKLLATATRPPA